MGRISYFHRKKKKYIYICSDLKNLKNLFPILILITTLDWAPVIFWNKQKQAKSPRTDVWLSMFFLLELLFMELREGLALGITAGTQPT